MTVVPISAEIKSLMMMNEANLTFEYIRHSHVQTFWLSYFLPREHAIDFTFDSLICGVTSRFSITANSSKFGKTSCGGNSVSVQPYAHPQQLKVLTLYTPLIYV